MPRFLHSFVGLDDLPTTTLDGKRHYLTPAGVLPSVTTVLGEKLQTSKGLDEWRARVGEQEADRISKQALSRGSAVHSICENYILNKDYRPASCRWISIPSCRSSRIWMRI